MDAISYSYADKQAKRIKKFINDPDSTSGVLTVPKVIASGESVTIPAGRVAVLPNVQVDGTLNIEGDVFIPSGATMSKVVETEGNQTISGVKTFSSSPVVPTPTTDFQATTARSTNITVNVGTGQTYTTINQALEYLSGFYPLHKTTGVTATINLKAGFVMAEQVLVRGLNLGWITIVGEDAETIITHTALTTDFTWWDYGFAARPAFGVSKGGVSPRIGQLFRFNVEKVGGEKHGIMAVGAGSIADVLNGKGFIGAGANGIYATNGSTINANGANVSNAGANGIYATNGSTINANGANVSNARNNGISADFNSPINANGANASNAGDNGIYAGAGSIISALYANASSAGNHGIYAISSSMINAYGAIIQNQTTGTERARVLYGSTISVEEINVSGGTVPAFNQAVNILTSNGIIYQ